MELLAESTGLRPRHARIAWAFALVALAVLALAPEALGQEHGGGGEEDEGGSFLVSPGLGLMIWTLILFGVTMFVLAKTAFPRIGEALEKRANAIRENIEASERQRAEADELLQEYRHRLTEAREQADDIAARARKAAEAAVAEATAEGKEKREELVAAARWSRSARRSPT